MYYFYTYFKSSKFDFKIELLEVYITEVNIIITRDNSIINKLYSHINEILIKSQFIDCVNHIEKLLNSTGFKDNSNNFNNKKATDFIINSFFSCI